MAKSRLSAQNLTDEEVLKEFVRRFECDGAVLIYLDSGAELGTAECGFGRWRNSKGKHWVDGLFKRVKQEVVVPADNYELDGGTRISLSV
ncbi:hypothetical protein [Hymenobacter sp. B1770]|uniref:hypothetical protein n=1 Tax=Hymenobacter sp. B1770 TaxID=1718788 RepID=UPI003CEB440E